jgi:endo-1,4-beta-mannosidase
MQRHSAHLDTTTTGGTWLGANFWSRAGGPRMWTNYDPQLVRRELAVLAEHGLTMTRSFFYWPDFMPTPDRIDDVLCERYSDFLDAHLEVGMQTVPTFLVGHMSGENWYPSWQQGRDLYADVWMVGRQAWFVQRMTERFAHHDAVCGWLISNEMPVFGRLRGETPAPREQVTAWAQLVVQAVRAGGGHQPVSLGDGAWGIEVTGKDNGFSLRDTAEFVDFVGPHIYRVDNDVVRQHHRAAFECELAAVSGRPVVLEEFGLSTDTASARNAGHYYRQALHGSLLGGARGWVAWNNTDFDDLADVSPYDHHGFELHFGITDSTGAPKEPLREMAAFAQIVARVDVARCRRVDTDAALLVPAFLEKGLPYGYPEDRPVVFDALRQAYTSARGADLPLAFVREADGLDPTAALYLLPSTRQITAPTRNRLEELAREGATVYLSYLSGETGTTRGPWFQDLDGLFGVRQQLSYWVQDLIEDDVVEMRFEQDFGPLRAGTVLRFAVAGSPDARAYLPVEPDGAEVVARDAHGRPALLRHRLGAGEAILSTYPVEYLAAKAHRVNPEDTVWLYDALAEVAGVGRAVTVDHKAVGADVLVHEDGRRYAWLVSQSAEPVTVAPVVAGGALHTLDGQPVGKVELDAYGVAVLEIIRG